MKFLDRFEPDDRDRLLGVGRQLRLTQGDYLIRRGERGGDIFLLESGALEIVDTRSQPEVVLDVVGPGAVVGEYAFMDESPRAADVRATGDATCWMWEYGTLKRELEKDALLAAAFYRAIAGLVVDRARTVVATAVVGGIKRREETQASSAMSVRTTRRAQQIGTEIRTRWLEAEARLRGDPDDEQARAAIKDAFDDLVRIMAEWLETIDTDHRQLAGAALAHELSEHLHKSTLASLTSAALDDVPAGANGVRHLMNNLPSGLGPVGEVLDETFLGLPTAVAQRVRLDRMLAALPSLLPERQAEPLRILLVNGAYGGLPRALIRALGDRPACVSLVEGDRSALAHLDRELSRVPEHLSIRLIHDDLAKLCMGLSSVYHEPQDLIILDRLLEYLPDRLAAALFDWAADHLRPGAAVLATAMAPSRDRFVFDHLISWPMIRRTAAELCDLLNSTRIGAVEVLDPDALDTPGLLVRATSLRPGVENPAPSA